jgi:tetratricopeptide (TPR) repeat protein
MTRGESQPAMARFGGTRGRLAPGRCRRFLRLVGLLCWCGIATGWAAAPDVSTPFGRGLQEYRVGGYSLAAETFGELTRKVPSTGSFYNLGLAQWEDGETGEAILAWERALWLAPRYTDARNNLAYARKYAQLGAPELRWYEVCSTWLPPGAWGWLAAVSFWTAICLVLLPGIFRWPRNDWLQAGAAASLAVFLLSTPALLGVNTRAKLGVVRVPEAALLLTPTRDGQSLLKLAAGEVCRQIGQRGDYVRIRTGSDLEGWLRREEFARISQNQ